MTRISGSNIDSAFGSTMSQAKLVLFTDKEETPGLFRALAASFRKYKLLFFTIHSSDEQAKKTFNIQKVSNCLLTQCACLACADLQPDSLRGFGQARLVMFCECLSNVRVEPETITKNEETDKARTLMQLLWDTIGASFRQSCSLEL